VPIINYDFFFRSNEEFLGQGGVINMTASLQNTFFLDKPNYEITICLISDYWGMFLRFT